MVANFALYDGLGAERGTVHLSTGACQEVHFEVIALTEFRKQRQ